MITAGAVQVFARQAQSAKAPAGLYGIFGENEEECAALWRYLEVYTETCDDLVATNKVQEEVSFANGARVRVFCSAWRTYHGLRFADILLSDESIRDHVKGMIYHSTKPTPITDQPKPVFGL